MPTTDSAPRCQGRTASGEQCKRTTTKVPPDCGEHPRANGGGSEGSFSPDALGEQAWRSRQIDQWGGTDASYELDAEVRSMTALRLEDRRSGHCRCPHGLCGVHGLTSDDPAEAFKRVYEDSIVKAYTPDVAEKAAQVFAEDFDPEDPHASLGWGWPYLADHK